MRLRAQPFTVSKEMLVEWDATELPLIQNHERLYFAACCVSRMFFSVH